MLLNIIILTVAACDIICYLWVYQEDKEQGNNDDAGYLGICSFNALLIPPLLLLGH